MKVIKLCDGPVTACCLGENSPLERELLDNGLLRLRPEGGYEVFSQEVAGFTGERAEAGDYVKVDSSGKPYPNKRDFFLNHHELREGNWYQIPQPMEAWELSMPENEAVRFMVEKKGLRIDESDPAHTFRAALWGTELTAAHDAVILYHKVRYAPDGGIEGLSFRFIARDEFEKTYQVIE